MNYAKLYVDVYTHPRFIEAGFEASGYWMHALAYLRHHESSDGFLADSIITVPLAAKRSQCVRLCERLVSVGLFQRVEGGYLLLRYAERNETKADIALAKEAARERKAKSRLRRAGHASADDTRSSVTRDVPFFRRHAAPDASKPVPLKGTCVTCDAVCICSGSVSGSGSGSASTPDAELPSGSVFGRADGNESNNLVARPPLPASERAISGSFWLTAFTEGIRQQTGRPCTAGRMYIATLERVVEHHAPARDVARACTWIREQAAAFAAKWDGHHPAKGLTPDGLERWLNDGRGGPPQFGKPRVVQLPRDEWKLDDFRDLGAVMISGDTDATTKGENR